MPDPHGVAERILLIIYGLYATAAVLGAHDTAANAVALAEETVRARMSPAADPDHRVPGKTTIEVTQGAL